MSSIFQVNDQQFLDRIPVEKVEFIKFLFRAWKSKEFQWEPESSDISMEEREKIERAYAGLVKVLTLYDFVTCKSTMIGQ